MTGFKKKLNSQMRESQQMEIKEEGTNEEDESSRHNYR